MDDLGEALALIDLDERHWAAGGVEYRKATKVALRKVRAAVTVPDDNVRARGLDVYSMNWANSANIRTMFEQDLHAKPKPPFKYVVHRKWFAARVAYQLMHDHGLPIAAERKGKFEGVALRNKRADGTRQRPPRLTASTAIGRLLMSGLACLN